MPHPAKPGVYRHIDKESGNVEYVGQTNNLRKRQQEHVRTGTLYPERQVRLLFGCQAGCIER